MKILCVSHYYPPHVGGLEIVAQSQARSLAKCGHEVTVVVCASDASQKNGVDSGGVALRYVRAIDWCDKYWGIPFPLGGISMLRTIAREVKRADVVHLHDVLYMTSWGAYFCALLYKKPIILVQHVAVVSHPNVLVMWLQRCVYRTIGRCIFRKSSRIISYNKNVTDFLMQHRVEKGKVLTLRNGIDLSLFRPPSLEQKREARVALNLPPDKPLVLFVGRFVPKKGAHVLFEARAPEYDILFAGSGRVPPAWSEAAGIHVRGPFSQSALVAAYHAADVFVFPAVGEVFTLVTQEAMASGLPVVTTDEAAYREYHLDTELFVRIQARAAEVREAIQSILADPARQHRMRTYSLECAKRLFDWETNFAAVSQLYNEIGQKKPSVVTTSWDDGHRLDMRLAGLLEKYRIAGTFYISPQHREFVGADVLTEEQIRSLSEKFEIGAHTMTHPRLTRIDDEYARAEIIESRAYLARVVGRSIRSFCYPQGYYKKKHVVMVQKAGYTYARTVARFATSVDNPLAAATTLHTYRHWSDALAIVRAVGVKKFLRCYLNWDELAIELFNTMLKTGGVFHLWGHSWELEQRDDWKRLERVLAHIGNRDGVQYVTNAESV